MRSTAALAALIYYGNIKPLPGKPRGEPGCVRVTALKQVSACAHVWPHQQGATGWRVLGMMPCQVEGAFRHREDVLADHGA